MITLDEAMAVIKMLADSHGEEGNGTHASGCPMFFGWIPKQEDKPPCSCGLEYAQSLLREKESTDHVVKHSIGERLSSKWKASVGLDIACRYGKIK